jgi:precorrin-6B methylase 2
MLSFRPFRSLLFIVTVTLLAGLLNTESTRAQEGDPDAPYVPSPDTVVDKMLEMANVHPGDYLIDLGSGDGRIPIAAARQGAYAHGIEIDSTLVQKARQNALDAGVEDKVIFIQADLFKQDLSRANIITMYLFPELLKKLKPYLLNTMDPGTRIVSHLFRFENWKADGHTVIQPQIFVNQQSNWSSDSLVGIRNLISLNENAPDHLFPEHDIYLYIIPADLKGTWKWSINAQSFTATIEQHYQQINLSISSGTHSHSVSDSHLRGRRVSFSSERDGIRYNYSGKIHNDTIRGQIQVHRPSSTNVYPWKAVRSQDSVE